MGWNQKNLRHNFKAWAKDLNIRDFEGDSADDAVAFVKTVADQYDIPGLVKDGEVDEAAVKAAWGRKTVRIIADAGEDIVVDDGMGTAEADPEDEEVKELDEDEDENKAKSKKYKQLQKLTRELGIKEPTFMKSIHEASTKGFGNKGPAIHDGAERRNMKMYNDAVRNGSEYRGKRPLFPDAELAQKFGAGSPRLMATKGGFYKRYEQLENDCAIVGTKAGSTTDNAFAGSLIVDEVSKEIIDNLVTHGAARQIVNYTPMATTFEEHPRKTANMSMSYRDENGSFSETNPAYDRVGITAHEAGGICRISNIALNTSAFNIGDEVASATIEGRDEFEDEEYFNGTYGTHGGLVGTCGADSDAVYDAANASWDDWTINKLQAARAKVPAKAWKRGNVKLACSTAFLQSVIYRYALSAGGNAGDRLLVGITNGVLAWDGVPIVLTEVLPSTFSANQIVAYIGDFDAGTKVGLVNGSEGLSSSDQRYWELDQFAWKYTEAIGFTYHDVTGTNSMVIGLKD